MGIIGYVSVGDLGEGLFESMAWIEQLACRWEQKLQHDDGDLGNVSE